MTSVTDPFDRVRNFIEGGLDEPIAKAIVSVQIEFNADLTDVKTEMKGLNAKFENIDTKVDNLDKKVDRLETKVDNLDKRVDRLETKVERIDAKVDNLDKKVDGLEARLDNKIDGLETRMDSKVDGLGKRIEEFNDNLSSSHKGLQLMIVSLFVTTLLAMSAMIYGPQLAKGTSQPEPKPAQAEFVIK